MSADTASASPILAHYVTGYEARRLESGTGQLERARTQELLERYLPAPPARLADVGGGPASYSAWLASRGYTVELLDIVPLHIEMARQRFEAEGLQNARAEVGDARQLPYASDSQHAALLMGPLYHLSAAQDRLAALTEAHRVLTRGGIVLVAAISRFASLLDGFRQGFIADPVFRDIVDRDLETGRHENPSTNPMYFTTAYFHHPDDLARELEQAGFTAVEVLPVEGPFWWLPEFEQAWSSDASRQRMLDYLRRIEGERSLLGMSAHLLAVGKKPA
jgi:ubiquinone/menaquinone biosynthesis C-methylase UbiE